MIQWCTSRHEHDSHSLASVTRQSEMKILLQCWIQLPNCLDCVILNQFSLLKELLSPFALILHDADFRFFESSHFSDSKSFYNHAISTFFGVFDNATCFISRQCLRVSSGQKYSAMQRLYIVGYRIQLSFSPTWASKSLLWVHDQLYSTQMVRIPCRSSTFGCESILM